MSDTSSAPVEPNDAARSFSGVQPTAATGWVGWIAFAGVVMIVLGSFHLFEGLVAIFKDTIYLVGESGLVVSIDYTAWGWVHLLMGAVLILAGLGVLRGQVWARAVGVFMALLSAVVNFGFLPAYPIWSTLMIAVDLIVIWALMVHGDELRD